MSKLFYYILFSLCLTAALSACDEDTYIPSEKNLNIEGWIEAGEPPVVILSQSLPLEDVLAMEEMFDMIKVDSARITVSDGTNTAVLYEDFNPDYLPAYTYTTDEIIGEEGKTYTLTVEAMGKHATATTTIPKRVVIDSLTVTNCHGQDTLYTINSYISKQEPLKYFASFVANEDYNGLYIKSSLGSFSNEVFNHNDHYLHEVRRGKFFSMTEYQPYYKYHEVIDCKITAISEELFDYWETYSKMASFYTNPLSDFNTNLKSNIKGARGYWAGYNSVKYHIIVPDKIYKRN